MPASALLRPAGTDRTSTVCAGCRIPPAVPPVDAGRSLFVDQLTYARTLNRVIDDLAQFIAGRSGWAMQGKAAVLTADNGWTGRVREQNQYARFGERYHAAGLDPRGVARHTRPATRSRKASSGQNASCVRNKPLRAVSDKDRDMAIEEAWLLGGPADGRIMMIERNVEGLVPSTLTLDQAGGLRRNLRPACTARRSSLLPRRRHRRTSDLPLRRRTAASRTSSASTMYALRRVGDCGATTGRHRAGRAALSRSSGTDWAQLRASIGGKGRQTSRTFAQLRIYGVQCTANDGAA